ncbi:MAG: hypothetical protein OHK0056_14630 [Bacteriovoracaceae bacterium]
MKTLVAALMLLGSWQVFACDMHGKTGIVEHNNLWIPADIKNTHMTKEVFSKIIADVKAIYDDVVDSKGGKLVVVENWDDGTVNAFAKQEGGEWQVHMFGGLARHETVTPDGFALVVCHELGHHLGGAPKKKDFFGMVRWATNEGQADYWGSMKCLRKYFATQNNQAVVAKMQIDQDARVKCQSVYSSAEEQAICMRASMAGKSLASLFRSLRGMATEINFNTPDTSKVSTTNDNHPQPQCRLDTYFSGSLCDRDSDEEVSDSDLEQGVCTPSQGYILGTRPGCWFATAN